MKELIIMKKFGPFYIILDNHLEIRWFSIGFKNPKLPSLSFRYHSVEYRKRAWKNKMNYILTWLTPWTIYYIIDSRDCDHLRVITAHKASNGRNYIRYQNSAYDGAEGPTSVWRVSRKEYENHTTSIRDYILEAHENGHAHCVDY